jgi:Mg-chelatase subunit ChlD
MKRIAWGSLQIAIIFVAAKCLFPQQISDSQPRSILVNVLNRQGDALRDLDKLSFRVRLNGRPADVLDANYSIAPRRIVVLLDVSGSMRGTSEKNNKWQIARDALQNLLDQSPQEVSIAVLTFSTQVHNVFEFSQSRSSVSAWLKQGTSQRSDVKGYTALRDAIAAGVKMLQPVRIGDSIYVISDGEDSSSRVSASEMRRALSSSGIRLFAFLFEDSIYLTDEETHSRNEFLEMARDSGGFVLGVRGGAARGVAGYPAKAFEAEYNEKARDEIKSYTRELISLVEGFYTAQIDVSQMRKDAKVTLEILDKAGTINKNVAYTHQQFLPAVK